MATPVKSSMTWCGAMCSRCSGPPREPTFYHPLFRQLLRSRAADRSSSSSSARSQISVSESDCGPASGAFARAFLVRERLRSQFVRLIEEEPLSEGLHRALIRSLIAQARNAGALAAYARCKEILSRLLHAEPALPTQALSVSLTRTTP